MHRLLIYRYFTLLMTFLVLTSSVGFGWVENYCMMRGKTVSIVFSEKKKGCTLCRTTTKAAPEAPPTDGPVFKKLGCCVQKYQLSTTDIQSTSGSKELKTTPPLPDNLVSSKWFTLFFQGITAKLAADPAAEFSFTSLYAGRSMLVFVQRFLI